MKNLLEFMNNKNKIAYTLKKAYDMGFADSDSNDRFITLNIMKKMQKQICSTNYLNSKISYAEMFIDFMNIIPNLNNNERLHDIFENFTIQYLLKKNQVDDMFSEFIKDEINKNKIIFINLCILNYNTERCEEDEAVHGTTIILLPYNGSYKLFYINSHGQDMKDNMEFHIIKTKRRCKVFKHKNVIDFIFLEKLVNYINKTQNVNINYQKNKYYNYWGANFQGGDSHGICFIFPYLIFYNFCKYYTKKKALLNGNTVYHFKKLLLNGNIDRLVHSCFIDFMKDVDNVDHTDKIDSLVVTMDYRFIKKVSNCFIAFISQSYFM